MNLRGNFNFFFEFIEICTYSRKLYNRMTSTKYNKKVYDFVKQKTFFLS